MQQQLYDIVANEAKFNGLITAIESCSAAKACSIFTIDSPITQKLHKLGDILKTLLQEESCSYKRKR